MMLLKFTKQDALLSLRNASSKQMIQGRGGGIILSEIFKQEWQELPDIVKQERRKSFVNRTIAERRPINFVYYNFLIDVVQKIIELIRKCEALLSLDKSNVDLLKILSILLIEKELIDEALQPKNHLDDFYFNQIAEEFGAIYPELSIADFAVLYSKMYKRWPEKPNASNSKMINADKKKNLIDELNKRYEINKNKYTDHYYLLSPNLSLIEWHSCDAYAKQQRRWQFLFIIYKMKNEKGVQANYYEPLVMVNDIVINMLESLNWQHIENEEIESIDTSVLQICATLLVVKELMDESILPKNHVNPVIISELAEKYHDKHPDLNLPELAKKYEEMYEHWPDKPKQE
ncbi:MAG: hypothetical protein H6575_06455 [Lewinellaceae bacterium]|nr:hypothetical protein [Lewinellaceae bacterium]